MWCQSPACMIEGVGGAGKGALDEHDGHFWLGARILAAVVEAATKPGLGVASSRGLAALISLLAGRCGRRWRQNPGGSPLLPWP